MASEQGNAAGAGKQEQSGQDAAGRRTGPDTGNMRGNDLPSPGGTQRDGRRIEGATGTPNKREAPGRHEPGHVAADPRDLKERKDEAQASDSAGRADEQGPAPDAA
jgi:hypothetical protein